jgi:hypothetical protein
MNDMEATFFLTRKQQIVSSLIPVIQIREVPDKGGERDNHQTL